MTEYINYARRISALLELYSLDGEKTGSWCKNHAPECSIPIGTKKCKTKKCFRQPCFGLPNGVAVYCSEHAPSCYEDVKNKKCKFPNCNVRPIFNYKGEDKPIVCERHATDSMVDVSHKRCQAEGCTSRAYYGIDGKAQFCKEHSDDDMYYKKYNTCIISDCQLTASFAKNNDIKPLYCKAHGIQHNATVNVKAKKCAFAGCSIQASYNLPGLPAKYCADHRPDDAIDTKNAYCKVSTCRLLATYGNKGGKAEYCFAHKSASHCDVKHKKCIVVNCDTRACFNYVGETNGVFCYHHSLPGMCNVLKKECIIRRCQRRANHDFPGWVARFCMGHALKSMVKNPEKYEKECDEYEFVEDEENKEDLHLYDSKKNFCIYCTKQIRRGVQLCDDCKIVQQVGKTNKRIRKEEIIKKLLDDNNIEYINNRQVSGGCSKRRPDFIINTKLGHHIILEVDEHQHRGKHYESKCEIQRMIQLYFDLGVKYLLFIRYNPDVYKAVGSVYNITRRHKLLLKILKSEIERDDISKREPLTVIYLFYDGFTMKNITDYDTIDPYLPSNQQTGRC